jgi:ATP-dependent Zn protease
MSDRRRIARHEAGHAVVAWLLGHELLAATIVASPCELGSVTHRAAAPATADAMTWLREALVVAQAGRAAAGDWGAEDDDDDSRRYARRILGADADERACERLIAAARREATAMAEDWWQAISDFATDLALFETLTGEHLRRVVAARVAQDRESTHCQAQRERNRAAREFLRSLKERR